MAKRSMKKDNTNTGSARMGGNANDVKMSVGNISCHAAPEPKTSGIKIRGTGAATKGVMARGPMA